MGIILVTYVTNHPMPKYKKRQGLSPLPAPFILREILLPLSRERGKGELYNHSLL